ncbi:MAG: RES family NAD+ phosphorylase, partial [Betaproteobacteria bacterium]|nr:RES family NAD+ phosphorylase [Betaproteobacteria bacterium]
IEVQHSVPLPSPDLPEGWRHSLATPPAIGDEWLRCDASPLLAVPSVVAPETTNVLLTPLHPDLGKARIANIATHPFDPRLRRMGGPPAA